MISPLNVNASPKTMACKANIKQLMQIYISVCMNSTQEISRC